MSLGELLWKNSVPIPLDPYPYTCTMPFFSESGEKCLRKTGGSTSLKVQRNYLYLSPLKRNRIDKEGIFVIECCTNIAVSDVSVQGAALLIYSKWWTYTHCMLTTSEPNQHILVFKNPLQTDNCMVAYSRQLNPDWPDIVPNGSSQTKD